MKHLFDYIRDGVTQSERYLPALHPSYVKIDDRSTGDLLMELMEFSKQIRYYDLNNDEQGHWEEFLQHDLRIELEYISRLDFGAFQTAQQNIRSELEHAGDEEQLQKGLTALFDLLYSIAILLGNQLELARQADTRAAFWNYIDQVMDSVELDVYHLLSYEQQALALFPAGTVLHTVDPAGSFDRSMQRAATDPYTNNFLGYESLNEIYNRLRARFYQVTSAAGRQLTLLEPEHQHHPHIGLLLTFLELYKQLQQRINQLTERHLEYYYKTVLGIPRKAARPDDAHVILVPAPQAPNQTIPENTLFSAELIKGQPPVLFRLLFDVPVSQTRLKALRTVFVSHHKQITARGEDQQDVIETQVYMQKLPIPTAAAYLPDAPPVSSWPMLGEEQAELGDNSRTMEILSMGFILASPVLYLEEGVRTLTIHLYGTTESFQKLSTYIANLSAVMNRKEDVLKWELLAAAFQVYYTAPEGWQYVKEYTARLTSDSIQLTFTIGMSAPPVVVYNQKVHSEQYRTTHPMVKVLLNNNSFHHPYSYLQYLQLDRITIHARVKGCRAVQLRNNVGPLSAANPFQLFGPAPAVGSYLQISNANIFNRYTKQFCLQLEWLDLPMVEGGFNKWYADYHAGMTNDAFQVSMSNMRDGVFMPAKEKRQLFPLFKIGHDKKLAEKTDIEHIDFIRINFNNTPLKSNYYEDGVVRLELTNPPVAFGQRLYTQLFPEVVTHNAGKWAKKRPIPNPPYIPLVKSITVDYELEHTQMLRPELVNEAEQHTSLYHIYPFGYRLCFPQSNESEFTLLPGFEHAANLYIGLDNVKQQEVLSFLFQLEEKYYSDTTGTLQNYYWSYLHNDKWLALEQHHILADSTQNFIRSGIIVLKMPILDAGGHTRLEAGIQWLRLSCTDAPATRPMVKGIFLNAGIVRREQAGTTVSTSLPPLSIKALQKEIRGIQQVYQFFPSFGGRPAETKEEYYVRVSERLRHKNRPILGVDVIQMVLEAYPDLLIAKYIANHEDAGPELQLIVVPKQQVPEPRADLATLYSIRDYIKGLLPPYMEVAVHNPVYERVKVICDVVFNSKDSSYYLVRIQEDIHHFLTPWLYDKGADLNIGSKIYKADLMSFIRKLPYVAYMTAFSIVHFFKEGDLHCVLDTAVQDVDFIMPSTPGAVLIPADHHSINVTDEMRYREPAPMGINSMITGEEMIVGRKPLPEYGYTDDTLDMEGEMIRLSIHSK
ncbi:hypothetical protein [Chitinophaga silvisoli]|uniref:Baseplate protein J-like domain-containing protein n=1 Tax=Chitinophaga silvisoli TaxID=2291814 RepID=A0A3E1NZF5_9BACT|nr:hypothetical protein [Chitinophaga silvisoli]RFM33312.1 hypothetical protein DXN04_20015 [Chitinophaga silvisoli]